MQENIYPTPQWNLAKKIAFRFVFVYFLLYNLPFPFNIPANIFPFNLLNIIGEKYNSLLALIVPWVGKHILQISYEVNTTDTGSGDRTFDYVLVLCFFAIALFVTVSWTLFDRKRPNYDYLHQLLRIYVRYSLATIMISYGAVKVIKSQFPYPFLSKLVQPFGDSSPMGLLWTFMGFSEPYNTFAGGAEMLGGGLLVFPQITTLGALICIGVMSNVLMLNMSYDVPVKLFLFHLILMAIFLLAPDLRRLMYLFILNYKVEGVVFRPLFERQSLNRLGDIFGVVFIFIVSIGLLLEAYEGRKIYGDLAPKPPLYGIWVVDEFEINGEVKAPLLTDETRWRRVIFEFAESATIQNMSEKKDYFMLKLDMEKKTLELGKYQDENWKANFSFEQPNLETMTWQGKLDDKPAHLKLHRLDETKFLLNSRGFRWVNEYPYNR